LVVKEKFEWFCRSIGGTTFTSVSRGVTVLACELRAPRKLNITYDGKERIVKIDLQGSKIGLDVGGDKIQLEIAEPFIMKAEEDKVTAVKEASYISLREANGIVEVWLH